MAYPRSDIYLEWLRLAEESMKRGDYEAAARNMRRIAHYFGFNNDQTRFREYVRKTGDCYLNAAERLWNLGRHQEASALYIQAADSYRQIGESSLAERCNISVSNYYATMIGDGLTNFQGSALDLKRFADYFREEGNVEEARECYEAAAGKAVEEGKLILAGGLQRDAGACSSILKDAHRSANNYAMAADNYFKSEKYFEAAWHYNISGFLLISMDRLGEALQMAEKARKACSEGKIPVILNSISRVCELLGRRDFPLAQEEWHKIRRKFKRTYAQLVDSCFHRVREVYP